MELRGAASVPSVRMHLGVDNKQFLLASTPEVGRSPGVR